MNSAPLFGAIAAAAAIRRTSEERRKYEEGLASRRHQATERFEQLEDEVRQSVTDNQQHPVSSPPDLVEGWILESDIPGEDMCEGVATRAAQWGADQELAACCEWVGRMFHGHKTWSDELRAARRPKPPSLKEQALIHFESFAAAFETSGGDSDLIRRALEALSDD